MNEYCAVVGAGPMGLGIAYVLAAAGEAVVLVEPDESRRDVAERTLAEVARDAVARGELERPEAEALLSRLQTVPVVAELPFTGAALVVEAVPERLELKRLVLRAIEDRCAPAILASTARGLSIDALADCLAEPARFLGLHFFNPVWVNTLVEVVRGPRTSADVVDSAVDLAVRIGKQPILVDDAPGFESSRQCFAPPWVLVNQVAAGELGKKSRLGFYEWP